MNQQKIIGIYLAAGQSSRFGQNKLLASLGKVPLGSMALETALQSKLDEVFVVTKKGDLLKWLPEALRAKYRKKVKILPCTRSNKGQSFSLKYGLDKAKKAGAIAIVVILADQPCISVHLINQLIEYYHAHRLLTFIGATYRGTISPPILFDARFFPRLYELKGDTGARQLIQHNVHLGYLFEITDPILHTDVDTVDDYVKLLQKLAPFPGK